jgi:hypothetical protein
MRIACMETAQKVRYGRNGSQLFIVFLSDAPRTRLAPEGKSKVKAE